MANFILPGSAFQSSQYSLVYVNGNLTLASNKKSEADSLQEKYNIKLDLRDEGMVNEFLELYQITLPAFPPEKYQKAHNTYLGEFRELAPKFQWNDCVPFPVYYDWLLTFVKQVSAEIDAVDTTYWLEHYVHLRKIKDSENWSSVTLDKKKMEEIYTASAPAQKILLDGWKTAWNANNPVRYSLTRTKTGRLTVTSGPNILTLKKEYRKIFTSSFGDKGSLWYFDYSSLEPRVLLALQGGEERLIGRVPQPASPKNIPQDVYQKVMQDLNLTGKVSREIVKTATLSVIYGQSAEHTAESLEQHLGFKPSEFISMINEYFGVEPMRRKLMQELAKTNGRYIENFYGRPVFVGDAKPYILLNYYVQSTAVDVAMYGFLNIQNRLTDFKLRSIIKPLFLLHDAIILDIHEDAYHVIPKIEKLGSTNIPFLENVNFFLKAERL